MRPESERVRVIVCGTRTFADSEFIWRKLDVLTAKLHEPIVCTGFSGAVDRAADSWGLSRYHTVKRFHADWTGNGRAAGPIRNMEMASYACERKGSACIAFWDGKSSGTKDMLNKARVAGLTVRIIRIDKCPISTSSTGRRNSKKSSGNKRQ